MMPLSGGKTNNTQRNYCSAKSLWAIRGLYFFNFAAVGVFFTFINVYYKSIGLTGTQIGLINTVGPLIGVFSTTLWGMLSDRLGKTRLLVALAAFGIVSSALALSAADTFLWILIAAGSLALFNSALVPLVDSTAMSVLGEHRERYGSLRVWGSVGFILTSSTIGFLFERMGMHILFFVYAGVMGLLLLTSLGMPEQPVQLGGSLLHGMNQMIRQPRWMLFATCVFLLWIATSGTMTFVSIVIKGMGGSDQLIGLSWSVAALFELPVMFFSGALLRRFGAARLLFLAFAVYIPRITLYGLMPLPEWVIPINALHALTFVPFWVSAVNYAAELAPPNLKATAQGMFFSVMNLAGMTSGVLSGWLFDTVGSRGLFLTLAGFCVAAFLLFTFGQWTFRRWDAEGGR